MIPAAAGLLVKGLCIRWLARRENLFDGIQTLLEWLSNRWCIKHQIPHLAPQVGTVAAPHDRDRPLELFPTDPEFAVERSAGSSLCEPLGRDITVAVAGQELASIPIGTGTIAFFAEPPAAWIGLGACRSRSPNPRNG